MTTAPRETPTPRAERYPLVMPLRIRTGPNGRWMPGRTENVSLTGVLACLDGEDLVVGTPVEMVLGLTDEQPGARHVICLGRVVREDADDKGRRRIAVTIEHYRSA